MSKVYANKELRQKYLDWFDSEGGHARFKAWVQTFPTQAEFIKQTGIGTRVSISKAVTDGVYAVKLLQDLYVSQNGTPLGELTPVDKKEFNHIKWRVTEEPDGVHVRPVHMINIIMGKLNNGYTAHWKIDNKLMTDDLIGSYAIVENQNDFDMVKIIGLTTTIDKYEKYITGCNKKVSKNVVKLIPRKTLRKD